VGAASLNTSRPEILLGGTAPAALRRAGRLGDGYLAMPVGPEPVAEAWAAVQGARREAGRSGPFRLVGAAYCALGDTGEEADANMARYYGFGGLEFVKQMQGLVLRSEEAVRQRIRELADVGMDELFLWPAVGGLDQVERLASARAQ